MWSVFRHQVAAEIAAPLSQAKKISMVADASGELGASKLTGEVLQIVQSVPGLVKNMTGVDISAQMGAPGGARTVGGTGPAGIGTRVSESRRKKKNQSTRCDIYPSPPFFVSGWIDFFYALALRKDEGGGDTDLKV